MPKKKKDSAIITTHKIDWVQFDVTVEVHDGEIGWKHFKEHYCSGI